MKQKSIEPFSNMLPLGQGQFQHSREQAPNKLQVLLESLKGSNSSHQPIQFGVAGEMSNQQLFLRNLNFAGNPFNQKVETEKERLQQNILDLQNRLKNIESYQRLEQQLCQSGDMSLILQTLNHQKSVKSSCDVLSLHKHP